MTGERQFERAAEANAVDGDSERLAAGLELSVEQGQTPRAVEELLIGRVRALFLERLGVLRGALLQHREIGAAGKGALARRDDAAFDGGVRRDLVD